MAFNVSKIMEPVQINLIVLLGITCIILTSMLFLEPVRYGDGNEYFLQLESLSNHLSPDLQERDVNDFYEGELNAFGEDINPYDGYFESKNNKWYSMHFWAYSLSCVPAKLFLDSFRLDARKALQMTNALLFVSMLAVINFSRLKEKQKMFLMLLLTLSPALWFVHWTHPEIFMLVFVTVSLLSLNLKKYDIAIISAAIASFQNQALVLFVLFLLIKAIISAGYKPKSLLKHGILSSLIFIPNIFYFINFEKLSLITRSASVEYISALRVFETFFDLNIGLFPYIPIPLLFFFGIVFYKTYKERRLTAESQILLLMMAMMAVCSMTVNWNHGTSGPSRYVVWLLPFIFFVIVKNIDTILSRKMLRYIFIAGVFLQLIIVIHFGPIVPQFGYLNHTYLAKAVLNYFPSLYNPSDQIFCERTSHEPLIDCHNPTIYIHNNECRKAFLTCSGLDELKSKCNITGKNIEDYCQKEVNKEEWFYVNY